MIEKIASTGEDFRLAEIGLNQQMFPVFLGILFAAAVAWIFLSRQLYKALKLGYPGVYESLGNPKLVMKKSFAVNYRVILFLVKREYETMENGEIIRLCQGLRYIFLIYLICLLGSLLLIFDKII